MHARFLISRCESDAAVILKAIRKQFSSKLLNKILLLKRSIHTVFQMVQVSNQSKCATGVRNPAELYTGMRVAQTKHATSPCVC